ncbi:DUF421 domain-containing protein [Paenibacillus pasadenensis]|uniref:DUF421 domain-containing protein n=1 Tax=Paenibacillus pasadenensis TaxID=217090 RepID=UPI0020400746|nr:DUF421 domain-containing protein [Paenibacillus pasadenensis]MCM3746682.1 DUF421 domain-containing protein [Paenibacillus pasadenensis]
MDIGMLMLRTVLIYFVVFLIMRMMGKREIGKMSVFDLVISFMIAEIAVLVIEDTDRAMLEGIVPMVVLMVVQVVIAFISMKNRRVRLLFDGKPSVIIENGKLNQAEMKKQRYNLDDLLQQLRENQVARVADVEFAILETSGKLSVIEKEKEQEQGNRSSASDSAGKFSNVTPPKMELPVSYRFETLPIPLIMDGKVLDHNLEKLEKNRFWLKQQLRKFNATNYSEVFFCSVDHKGELFVDVKNKK